LNARKFAFLILFVLALASAAQAEIKSVSMRVEGMT
jgi:hypothetical protein